MNTRFLFLLLACLLYSFSYGQAQKSSYIIKGMSIYYFDSLTNPKEIKYRKFEGVGDNVYWSKPTVFDIEMSVSHINYDRSDYFEIIIEELLLPLESAVLGKDALQKESWVPVETVFSGSGVSVVKDKVILKGVSYKTAYFLSSVIYRKKGFRLVGIHKKAGGKLDVFKREYFFSM